jgi:hypothetical protein
VPERYIVYVGYVSAALTAIGGAWIGIFKYMGLSKDNAEFKKEVNGKMISLSEKVDDHINDQKDDIDKLRLDIVDIKTGVSNNFSVHRDYLHENYPDRKEVQQGFDAQKNDREHMLTLVMDKLDTLTASQEKIDNFITKRRDEKMAADAKTIADLQRELRNKSNES